MRRMPEPFLQDETAATAIEYALLVAGLALFVIAVAVTGMGDELILIFTGLKDQFALRA